MTSSTFRHFISGPPFVRTLSRRICREAIEQSPRLAALFLVCLTMVAMVTHAQAQTASPCLYALDPSAQNSFEVSGSTSITTSCSAVVESNNTQAFTMNGSEILYLTNSAQVGVVGGWNLSGSTKLVNQATGATVSPVHVTSPGDPLASLSPPTQGGTIISQGHITYNNNHPPANNTVPPGVYCGGLRVGNTSGITFTMAPGLYVIAGGGLTLDSQSVVTGTGVTVYNTSSTGWGCTASASYTPVIISGQANVTLSAPTTGAFAGVLMFGDRAGCSTAGSCQDQVNGQSTTVLNGALYFKSDTFMYTGTGPNSGCMMAVADMININGNSGFTITGCGGAIGGVTVSVTPATATLYPAQKQQFTATVTNASNTAVTWSVSGAGTISSSGLYTAPSSVTTQQTVTITATSQADSTKSASATITLMPPVSVSVTPATATLYPAQTQQFTATVSNTSNTAVTWSVSGVGTVSSSGLYTAPASVTTQQTVTVTATSQAAPSASGSATITLMPAISVSVTPTSAALNPGQSQQFRATVSNTSNTAVTWSISPTSAGTISSSGLYAAPSLSVPVTVMVTATSQADPTKSGSATITITPLPPTANAGPGQTVPIGTTVRLDGSGSTDQTGTPLTYSWSFVSIPSGSAASLSSTTAVKPTFTADVYGNYTVQLVVNDGYHSSAPSQVVISTQDSAPVANAGPNQTVTVGTTVQLNGSGSTDVDGNPLTYQWSFLSIPTGSTATLSNATLVNPTFVADVPGNFVVQLIVNDGILNSAPATVTIGNSDMPPVANAGPAQTVSLGTLVTLDGTGSTDSDNKPLTYQWSLLSVPTGSAATLAQPTSAHPTFTADLAGNYIAQLIVNDGFLNSSPATVTISTSHSVPVANAGPPQTVTVNSTVQLTGSASSDVDGYPLTYSWSILSQPGGSAATLSNSAVVNPTFVPTVTGTYVIQLIVNDGVYNSTPATVTITVNSGID